MDVTHCPCCDGNRDVQDFSIVTHYGIIWLTLCRACRVQLTNVIANGCQAQMY